MSYRFKSAYHAIWHLCNTNENIKNAAHEYLLDCGEKAVKPLMNALWYPERYVADDSKWVTSEMLIPPPPKYTRNHIATLLIEIGSPAVQYLINSLFYADDYFIREYCANILRKISNSRATIPILIAMLEEHNIYVIDKSNPFFRLYYAINPPVPFRWKHKQLHTVNNIGDIVDLLEQFDEDFDVTNIEKYFSDEWIEFIANQDISRRSAKPTSEIMEEVLLNKIPLDDMETHIENCLILHKNLRPQYVLAVMHHNNFNLKDALTHYEAT